MIMQLRFEPVAQSLSVQREVAIERGGADRGPDSVLYQSSYVCNAFPIGMLQSCTILNSQVPPTPALCRLEELAYYFLISLNVTQQT